jgi:hypothetical protein
MRFKWKRRKLRIAAKITQLRINAKIIKINRGIITGIFD